MAQAFDTTSLRLAGEAAPLAESVAIRPQFARGVFFDFGYGHGDVPGPPVIRSRSWSGSIAMAARSAPSPALAATSVPRCRRMKRPSPSR